MKSLAAYTQDNINKNFKSKPFVLATGESNDNNYSLMAPYFCENKSKIIIIPSLLECSNTGSRIFNSTDDELSKRNIF